VTFGYQMDLLSIEYQSIGPYPEPTPVRVSTITALAQLTTQVDLWYFFSKVSVLDPVRDRLIHLANRLIRMNLLKSVCLYKSVEKNDWVSPNYLEKGGVCFMKYFIKKSKVITSFEKHPGGNVTTKKVKSCFQNQLTLIWKFRDSKGLLRKVNGFLFANGKIKATGLRTMEDIHNSVEQLRTYLNNFRTPEDHWVSCPYLALLYVGNCVVDEKVPLKVKENVLSFLRKKRVFKNDLTPIECLNVRSIMYNTDFSTNFKIMREELFQQIVVQRGLILSEYDPDIYPGVKIKFNCNRLYFDDILCKDGLCYCKKNCTGKGLTATGNGDGNCKRGTISVFQSGKVIITGANSYEQVQRMYTFINRVFKEQYENICYREPIITTKHTKKGKKKETLVVDSYVILPHKGNIKNILNK
jgi:TATA-box binding protein (TBP) (component of TFIID and TFIIIB)